MSGTAKRRHLRKRQAYYRNTAKRDDRHSRYRKRFYGNQLERAMRELSDAIRQPAARPLDTPVDA
jgi:hypothetical protein